MNESLLLQALCRLPLPEKLLHLFVLTVRYISVFSEVHKRWIWPCVHADTSQNLMAEPYLSRRSVSPYY